MYADTTRRSGALDPDDRELHVGLVCALENLVIAARERGLGPTVTLLPDAAAGSRVTRVALSPGTPEATVLYEAIGDRHTNRGPYLDRGVPASVLADLTDSSDLRGVTVHWVTGAAARASLGRLMIDAAVNGTRILTS